MLYLMYTETARRDGFTIREPAYYDAAWGNFMESGVSLKINGTGQVEDGQQNQTSNRSSIPMAEALIAEVEGEPVAAVIYYRFAEKAWYLFGMSTDRHREKMPNYLLQWEALRRAKACGCKTVDLWGAPEVFEESDNLFGVYRFKVGFGSTYVRHIGAWDYPEKSTLYRLYMEILPKILGMIRRRASRRIG